MESFRYRIRGRRLYIKEDHKNKRLKLFKEIG